MLTFNEEKHEYRLGDKILPSVSQVMQSITTHFYTKDIPQIALDKAALKGSAVHKAIYDYEMFGDYDLEECYKPYFENYLKFKEDYKPKILYQELMLENGEFAGTIDYICEIDGVTWLIDHKTSSQLHDKLVRVQLQGYSDLCSKNGIKIEKYGALHLTKDKYEFVEELPDKEMWETCLKCYRYVKEK